jgi:transcriptional regulator with XRE-family HTH domain
MEKVAREVMQRAYRAMGGHAQLLLAIKPHVRDSKREIKQNSASAWVTGRVVPPADVLLAAAKVAGVSIDDLLFGESLKARQDRLEREVRDLRLSIERPGP